MKVTALVENTLKPEVGGEANLKTEHGISLYLESDGKKLLFDTGASALFSWNAAILKCPLQDVHMAFISHGHYDHGGGLQTFFNENASAPVYLKEEAFGEYFGKAGPVKKYIGLNQELQTAYKNRFSFVRDISEIEPGIFIIPIISAAHPRPSANKKLHEKTDGGLVPDQFRHELIMAVRESGGLVVFTGCAHSGILNMIETVEKEFPGETMKAVFGGFHLMNTITRKMAEPEETVLALGRALAERKHLKKVYTGHCTGEIACGVLKSVMGEKLDYFSTGTVFNL